MAVEAAQGPGYVPPKTDAPVVIKESRASIKSAFPGFTYDSAGKLIPEGTPFKDAYIESNGTIHQKDPRDKILFFQDPNTIEIVKNTKSAAKQENMSGSPLSNDTMEELLKSILKELKFSNNKKTPAPKMDILGGKNLLMGNM